MQTTTTTTSPSVSGRRLLAASLVAIAIAALGCRITGREASATIRTGAVARVAGRCLPSVVTVHVATSRGGCQGSGIVISWDGQVLTNAHVVRPAATYRVMTWRGRTYRARLVRSDVAADLALLQVSDLGEVLTPMPLCDHPPIVGEIVVVIGNALGRGHIVTSGIVSAVDQTVRIGRIEFTGMVQSDAPINPGNSGGALLAVTGRLLGIVNSSCRGADGVGWAIPVVAVRRFLRGP